MVLLELQGVVVVLPPCMTGTSYTFYDRQNLQVH